MTKHTLLFLASFICISITYGQKTTISGIIKNLPNSQSIKCSFISNNILDDITAVTIPVVEGKFSQDLKIQKSTFLSFAQEKNYFAGFIQPGDSIVIVYDAENFKNSLVIFGKGKEKFNLVQSINKIRSDLTPESRMAKDKAFPADYFFSKVDSTEKRNREFIFTAKPQMNIESFDQLSSYLASTILTVKYNGIQNIFGNSTYDDYIEKERSKLTPKSTTNLLNLFKFKHRHSTSSFYIKAVYNLLTLHYENNILPKKPNNTLADKYSYLNNILPKNLKTPVLYLFLKNEIKNTNDLTIEPIIKQSFPSVKDSIFENAILSALANSRKLKVGVAAPDFSVEDKSGNKVSLTSFKGKVVYIDFWFATCSPCHALFNKTKSVKEYFKLDTNIVFLTVSVDNRETWERAMLKFNIEGYHVFTENKFRNHPIISSYNVTEYPTTYIIDKNGVIVNIAPSPNAAELKKEIETILSTKGN